MSQVLIKCPHCHTNISEDDFHENGKVYNQVLEKLKTQEKAFKLDIEKQVEKQQQQKFQDQLESQKIKIELEKTKEFEAKVQEITEAKTKLKIQLEQEKKIFDEKLESAKKLAIQEQKNANTSELNLKLKEIEDLKHKMAIQKVNVEKEWTQKIYEKEQELNQQIHELKISNERNKVIQNKTKGENFEQEVYGELLKVFDTDRISKINDKNQKADFLQEVVIDNKVIGKITYEVKNAEWKDSWEKKLSSDMALKKAKYGILIATSFNNKFSSIPFKRSDDNMNIYFTNTDSFVFVAQIIKILIKKEFELETLQDQSLKDNKNKDIYKTYQEWISTQWPNLLNLLNQNLKRISENEIKVKKNAEAIIKSSDDIRIAREKIESKLLEDIKKFIEELKF